MKIIVGIVLYSFYLIRIAFGQGALLTATSEVVLGTHALNVDCRPSDTGNGYKVITFIQIKRNSSSTLNNVVVSIYTDSNGAQIAWQDLSIKGRAVAVGDITSPSDAYLTLTFKENETLCEDGTGYLCFVGGLSTSFESITHSAFTHVDTYALPSKLDISVGIISGSSKCTNHYLIGTELEIHCSANVGNMPSFQNLNLYILSENDSRFKNYTPPAHDIIDGSLVPIDECDFSRNSTLRYTVKDHDTHTTIMCQIGNLTRAILSDTIAIKTDADILTAIHTPSGDVTSVYTATTATTGTSLVMRSMVQGIDSVPPSILAVIIVSSVISITSLIIVVVCVNKGCKCKREKSSRIDPATNKRTIETTLQKPDIEFYKQEIENYIRNVTLTQFTRLKIEMEQSVEVKQNPVLNRLVDVNPKEKKRRRRKRKKDQQNCFQNDIESVRLKQKGNIDRHNMEKLNIF